MLLEKLHSSKVQTTCTSRCQILRMQLKCQNLSSIVKNIVGKGKIAGHLHFLLFLQSFQKTLFWTFYHTNPTFNSLPNNKTLNMTKSKVFADHKLNITKITISSFGRVENTVGKGRKCWLPAFSPFPTVFSKDFILRVFKSQDCVVKS